MSTNTDNSRWPTIKPEARNYGRLQLLARIIILLMVTILPGSRLVSPSRNSNIQCIPQTSSTTEIKYSQPAFGGQASLMGHMAQRNIFQLQFVSMAAT
jgi:hypothetical protein